MPRPPLVRASSRPWEAVIPANHRKSAIPGDRCERCNGCDWCETWVRDESANECGKEERVCEAAVTEHVFVRDPEGEGDHVDVRQYRAHRGPRPEVRRQPAPPPLAGAGRGNAWLKIVGTGSGTVQVGSGSVQVGSGSVQVGSGCGASRIRCGASRIRVGASRIRGGASRIRGGKVGSGAVQVGSGAVQVRSGSVQSRMWSECKRCADRAPVAFQGLHCFVIVICNREEIVGHAACSSTPHARSKTVRGFDCLAARGSNTRLGVQVDATRVLHTRSQAPLANGDAVNSVCRNIAEGFGCKHKEFARFLKISRRSLNELGDPFRAAQLKRYVTAHDYEPIWRLTHRLYPAFAKLIRYLQTTPDPGTKTVPTRTDREPTSTDPESPRTNRESRSHQPEAHSHRPRSRSHQPEAHSHRPRTRSHQPEAHSHQREPARTNPKPTRTDPESPRTNR